MTIDRILKQEEMDELPLEVQKDYLKAIEERVNIPAKRGLHGGIHLFPNRKQRRNN